jgi:L-iditol 2-dehydrogenase
MKGVKIHGVRDARVHDGLPEPVPAAGEVLVRVRAVGICGSDLHYYREGGIGSARIRDPLMPGHEVAAEVAGGTGEPCGLADGTLVAVDPAQPCGGCEQCLAGYPNLCPKVRFLGSPGVDGGLCEFLSVPAQSLFTVPAGFDAALTAMLEPLGVALHALDITRVRPMSGVAVLGGGPLGLMIAQVARVAGAGHVRLIEPIASRREAALALGADSVHADYREALDASNGRGEDYVIEATNSPDGPEEAAQVARIGGRVTLVGIPDGDCFTLSAANARRKGLILRFSRRMGHVFPRAMAIVAQGRVQLAPLASHAYPLARSPEAFEAASEPPEGFLKAMIYPVMPSSEPAAGGLRSR